MKALTALCAAWVVAFGCFQVQAGEPAGTNLIASSTEALTVHRFSGHVIWWFSDQNASFGYDKSISITVSFKTTITNLHELAIAQSEWFTTRFYVWELDPKQLVKDTGKVRVYRQRLDQEHYGIQHTLRLRKGVLTYTFKFTTMIAEDDDMLLDNAALTDWQPVNYATEINWDDDAGEPLRTYSGTAPCEYKTTPDKKGVAKSVVRLKQ